jgi:hypothetical protein
MEIAVSEIAWESTTTGYIKFITDERYQKFSDEVKRWYKPYKCSSCAKAQETIPVKYGVELSLCPCCGGKPMLSRKSGRGRAGASYSRGSVECRRCGLSTKIMSPWEKAVGIWNKRYDGE